MGTEKAREYGKPNQGVNGRAEENEKRIPVEGELVEWDKTEKERVTEPMTRQRQ